MIGHFSRRSASFTRSLYSLKGWIRSKAIFKKILKNYLTDEVASTKMQGLLHKANIFDIAGARLVGLHNHIIMFSLGHFGVGPLNAFCVNTIFVKIDLFFYWVIVGGGQMLLNHLFPQIDIAQLVVSENFSNYLIIFTLLAYLAYFMYRFLLRKKKV